MKAALPMPPAALGDVREVFDLRRADLSALEKNGALLDTKDLARVFQLHPRTIKRLWKRTNVQPLIGGRHPHRWTYRQAQTLLHRWRELAFQSGHVRSWNNGKTAGLQ